jgi:thiamine-monophosphate kinase
VGEFDVITRYFSSLGSGEFVDLSVGDDAAALIVPPNSELIVSTDSSVLDTHFTDDLFPEDVGYKAVASAVSDLAAMGAEPVGMTLALTVPSVDDLWLHGLSQGLARACHEYRLPLVGGDTTRGPLSLTLTVMGFCPRNEKLLRSGARVGDKICVSGCLGDAAFGLAIMQGKYRGLTLDFDDQEYLVGRFTHPTARLDLGCQLRQCATSCIDLSDGLLQDAAHVANASGVRFSIHSSAVPLSTALVSAVGGAQALEYALSGGEDYELLFTLPPDRDAPDEVAVIGTVEAGEGVYCDVMSREQGYDHFH